MSIWIKICGTTSVEDALASIAAGADALGFVFAPSKRRVFAARVQEMVSHIPVNVERIGVFSNELPERVAETVKQAGLTGIQLHGEEGPEFIQQVKNSLMPDGNITVTKTVLVDDRFEMRFAEVCRDYDCIDSILLDSGGGSGRTFAWRQVQPFLQNTTKRLIVAGGLNPGNVAEAVRKLVPWGVDVVSGVEQEPGHKDREKLNAFVTAVRRAEQS